MLLGSRPRALCAAADSPATTSIAALPDDVLVRCLGLLELNERLRGAAQVSKRFAALSHSPELLREVEVGFLDSRWAQQSLAAWLTRHGQHIQVLELWPAHSDPDECAVARLAFAARLAGVPGPPLELTIDDELSDTEWLAAMCSLRRLSLLRWGELRISPAISTLTRLEALLIDCHMLEVDASVRLPPSITRLRLEQAYVDQVPRQIFELPRLEWLLLGSCGLYLDDDDLAPLSRLAGSLTRLNCLWANYTSNLSALTRLQHLSIRGVLDETTVGDTLPHLTQLTCLVLRYDKGADLPAELPSYPGLQRCYMAKWMGIMPCDNPDAPELPGGLWANNLRWLAADAHNLIDSVAMLQGCSALEFISVVGNGRDVWDWGLPAAAAFFDWLAQHAALQRLTFEPFDNSGTPVFDCPIFRGRMARLRQVRPLLEVRYVGLDGWTAGCYAPGSFLHLLGEE